MKRSDAVSDPGDRFNSGLAPAQVRGVVMENLGAIRSCYKRAADAPPGVRATITLQWTIDPTGAARGVSVVERSGIDDEGEACIVRAISSWRFPSSNTSTKIAGFPFHF